MIHFLQPSYLLLNADTKPAGLLELIPLLWKKKIAAEINASQTNMWLGSLPVVIYFLGLGTTATLSNIQ